MTEAEIAVRKEKVDKFHEWTELQEQCKKEIDSLKAEFQKLGVAELEGTKTKQVEFWGNGKAKVVVTCSESLVVVSHKFLSRQLGDALDDFTKEDIKYKYTDPFKRLLLSIFQGTYIDQSVDDVIGQITDNNDTQKTLKKKLKGNWEKDVAALVSIAKLEQKDAEHFAYFIQEAYNYQKIVQLLETAGHKKGTEEFAAAIQAIKTAVIVEEGIKVGLEAEDAD